MKSIYWIGAALITLSASAFAQGCPNGIPAASNPSCIPPDSPASPYYQTPESRESEPIPQKWVTRWGAIAVDTTIGAVGSSGQPSRRAAENEALRRCRVAGGISCDLRMAYHNQCAVLAWGLTSFYISSEATLEQAEKKAIEGCGTEAEDCKITYKDCSLPGRLQ